MNTTTCFITFAAALTLTVSIGLAEDLAESPVLDSKLYELHFQKGMEHHGRGESDLARHRFLIAIYLNPDHPGANYQLGLIAASNSNDLAAISFLERANVGMPGDVERFYWLGRVYCNKNLAEGVIKSYRKAVDLDPHHENPFSLYAFENLAEVYTRTEHLQESLEAYQSALMRKTRKEWIDKINNQIAELYLTIRNVSRRWEHTV